MTKILRPSSRPAVGAVLLAAAGLAGATPPTFRVTDLGLPAGYSAPDIVGLNDQDEVLGEFATTVYPRRREQPFTWSPAAGLVLGSPQKRGEIRELVGIDGSGVIVGSDACHTCNELAFTWRTGHPKHYLKGLYPGAPSWAYGVSRNGTVVGATYNDDADRLDHAVSWTAGGNAVDRHPPAMWTTEGVAINDAGQITGWGQSDSSVVPTAMRLEPDGRFTIIGTFPGGNYSFGRAINAGGTVVGSATFDANFSEHPFSWTPETGLVDLAAGTPFDALFGSALSIDDAGVVVGIVSQPTSGAFVAFRWDAADGLHPLVELVDPADPLAGRVTFDDNPRINSAGHIAVKGTLDGVEHAFLLVPVVTQR